MICVCVYQGFWHAISQLQTTSYQLSLGHLDHEELLIRRVLELQMKCFTKVFIKTSSNNALLSIPSVPLFVIGSEARSRHAIDVQCSRDRIIIEFGGFPSNGSRFFGVLRQDTVQDIINVRESPVSRLWAGWRFKSFFDLTISRWLLVILKGNSRAIQVVAVDKYFLYYSSWKG